MTRYLHYALYGALYMFLFIGLASVFYAWLLRPSAPACFNGILDQGEEKIDCGGTCTRPCVFSGASLKIERVWNFIEEDGSTSVLAQVVNPNAASAAEHFDYTFRLFDEVGGELIASRGNSFIYGGETKYLLLSRVRTARPLGHATVSLGEARWVKASAFPIPQLSLSHTPVVSAAEEVRIRGTVTNNDSVVVRNVKIFALFYGEGNDPLAVGEEELPRIEPGESKSFVITHSRGTVDPSRTGVIMSARRQ